MSKPVFSSLEQVLIWQGIDRLIKESEQQRKILLNGFTETQPDKNTEILVPAYIERENSLRATRNKLPQLAYFMKGENSGKA